MSQPVPRGGDNRKHSYRGKEDREKKDVIEVYIIEKVKTISN